MKFATLSCLTLLAASTAAQTVTVSTTPQNAEQVYYRLTDDAQTSAALADWDIAFEIGRAHV